MNKIGSEVFFVNKLHSSTKRDYLSRMNDGKVEAMIRAKEYGFDYWDGERRYGYGGYKYIEDRWKSVAEDLIERYSLANGDNILDIGCGKGFLLFEIQKMLPGINLYGIDSSKYAMDNLHPDLNLEFILQSAEHVFPFEDKFFKVAFSLGTLHNLHLDGISFAINEIMRVAENSYIMVESYRNENEFFNVQCWALTAETLLSKKSWLWLFDNLKYRGDYEFIYFE